MKNNEKFSDPISNHIISFMHLVAANLPMEKKSFEKLQIEI